MVSDIIMMHRCIYDEVYLCHRYPFPGPQVTSGEEIGERRFTGAAGKVATGIGATTSSTAPAADAKSQEGQEGEGAVEKETTGLGAATSAFLTFDRLLTNPDLQEKVAELINKHRRAAAAAPAPGVVDNVVSLDNDEISCTQQKEQVLPFTKHVYLYSCKIP